MTEFPPPVLELRGLTVRLPAHADRENAIEDVSLTVRPHEILCVVGESGSGKSVTAHAIMGLLPPKQLFPTAGQIGITLGTSRSDYATWSQVWQSDCPGNYQLSLAVESDSGDQVCSMSSWNLPDLQQFHSLDTCISRSN